MRLYELPEAVRRIDALLDESDGEVTPDIEFLLAELDAEVTSKVDWLGGLIAEAKREAEGLKDEATRLIDRAASQEIKVERLTGLLLQTLEAMGETKVKGRLFTASVCRNSAPSIRWTADGDIPREFRRTKVELDGAKALEAFKAGTLPDGFTATVGHHLRIR